MLNVRSHLRDNWREDKSVDDTDLLDPTTANAFVQGEWVTLNSSQKVVRVSTPTTALAYQIFSQKGDTSCQAIGKVAVMKLHDYEADTDMFDGADTYAIGDKLVVNAITINSVVRAALDKASATGQMVVGFVTATPQDNGGKLRFQRHTPFPNP